MIRTVSLETAKLLKESGFIKDNISHAWCMVTMNTSDEGHMVLLPTSPEIEVKGIPELATTHYYDAPNTDELLEELPEYIIQRKWMLTIVKNDCGGYWVAYSNENGTGYQEAFINESLPECLAQMYLYLHKEGLLEKN